MNVFMDPVLLNISQYAIHTMDTALRSWQQVPHTLNWRNLRKLGEKHLKTFFLFVLLQVYFII